MGIAKTFSQKKIMFGRPKFLKLLFLKKENYVPWSTIAHQKSSIFPHLWIPARPSLISIWVCILIFSYTRARAAVHAFEVALNWESELLFLSRIKGCRNHCPTQWKMCTMIMQSSDNDPYLRSASWIKLCNFKSIILIFQWKGLKVRSLISIYISLKVPWLVSSYNINDLISLFA